MQVTQRRARVDAQFTGQDRAQVTIGAQRIGLAAGPVQASIRSDQSRSASGFAAVSVSSSAITSPCRPPSSSASARDSSTARRISSRRAASARTDGTSMPAKAVPRHSARAPVSCCAAAAGSPAASAAVPSAASRAKRSESRAAGGTVSR
jgi:hypothetical protein